MAPVSGTCVMVISLRVYASDAVLVAAAAVVVVVAIVTETVMIIAVHDCVVCQITDVVGETHRTKDSRR